LEHNNNFMAEHNDFGKQAETEAAEFLKRNGYEILARNWRYLKAEIDIIALNPKKDEIVIVEVKARKFNPLIPPEEAVSKSKRKLLIAAHSEFIVSHIIVLETRFDIISILKKRDNWEINHITNAFHAYE